MSTAGVGPLLERAGELGAAARALAEAAAGRGSVVWYSGPPGIGKSAVLAAAERLGVERGALVCRATARELEEGYPFGVALQFLEPTVHAADPADRAELLDGAAGAARPILDPGPDDSTRFVAGELFALIHGLYWVVANLAERAPLVLVVDDVQWADRPSIRLLHYLAGRVGDLGVTLFAASRPPSREDAPELTALLAHEAVEVLQLAPLSEAAVGELIGADAGDERGTFHRLAGGNPLLVHELVENLAAVRSLAGADATEVLPTVVRRVERLPADAQRLAHACAVAGDGCALALACRAAGVRHGEELAGALVDAAVLAEVDPIQFVHPLVRTSVLETMAPDERSRLHLDLADLLDAQGAPLEVVAAHLAAADPAASTRTVEVLRRAARRAVRTGSPDNAVRWLRRARAEVAPDVDRATLLFELAQAEAAADDQAWSGHRDDALALRPPPAEAARQLHRLSVILRAQGDLSRSAEVAWHGYQLAAGEDPDLADQLVVAHVASGMIDLDSRDVALRRLNDHVRGRDFGDTRTDRALLSLLAYEWAIAGGGPGQPTVDEVCAIAYRAIGERSDGPALALPFQAVLALQWCDELDAAERVLRAGLERARAEGDVVGAASCANFLAPIGLVRCAPADAAADAETAREAFKIGYRLSTPGSAGNLALARLELDDLAGAAAALELPDGDAARWLPGASYNAWLFAAGAVALADGRVDDAVTSLLECGRRQDQMGSLNPMVLNWRSTAALAFARIGDHERAHDLVAAELELANAFRAPRAIAAALRVAALLAPTDEQVDRFAEALAVADKAPSAIERVRCGVELGSALRRAGDRTAAREPLRTALALAEEGGAVRLARVAREELAATGAKLRRAATRGPLSLTPGERRVATLAARGRRNREIAEELFVSVKAVEFHLGNAFRKLGVSSRAELPGRLDGHESREMRT